MQPEVIPATEANELALETRFKVALSWVESARQVAKQTQNNKAQEIVDFISTLGTLAVPMPDGNTHYIFKDKPKYPIDNYFFLVPLLPEDADRLPKNDGRQDLIKGAAVNVAEYHEGSQVIYLPPHECSNITKGILLLHEGLHAKGDLVNKYDRTVPNAEWLEEADAFVFEFDLLQKLGGETYLQILDKLNKGIQPSGEDPSRVILPNECFTDEDRDELASALQSTTDFERSLWEGVIVDNAFWNYFQAHTDNPRDELAQYLKNR